VKNFYITCGSETGFEHMNGYQARDMIKREGYIAPVYLIRHTVDMLFGIKTICADLDLYMALQSESNPDPNSDPAFKLQITVSPQNLVQ